MFVISMIYTLSFILLPISYIFGIEDLKVASLAVIIGTGYYNFVIQGYRMYLLNKLLIDAKEGNKGE